MQIKPTEYSHRAHTINTALKKEVNIYMALNWKQKKKIKMKVTMLFSICPNAPA